jgi:hypothetical protein
VTSTSIHSSLEFSLTVPTEVTVRREIHSDIRDQGLLLWHRRTMRVGDVSAKELVLWSTTAPNEVAISVPAGLLVVWNVWRDSGAMHGLLGDAEIREFELPDGGLMLECSDGYAPRESTDLRVELHFDPPLTDPVPR